MFLADHKIECQMKNDNCGEVHLGLLTIGHTYQAKFDVIHSLGDTIQVPSLQTPVIEVMAVERLGKDIFSRIFDYVNPLRTNVLHHIGTSQLICNAKQLTGFYMMRNIGC